LEIITLYFYPNSLYAFWVSRVTQGFFYISAGVNHFKSSMIPLFLSLFPSGVPFKEFLVYASGVAEIVIGALYFVPGFLNEAAWAAILLLIAVFPANIACLLPSVQKQSGISLGGALGRLPIQLAFIYWAYQLTNLPFQVTLQRVVDQMKGLTG